MTDVASPGPARRVRPTNAEVFAEALLLGVIGFGGGLSVLATIRSRAVEKHGWMSEKEFANAATIAQMLPGGAAANALAYIGLRFGGQLGAAAGYVGFCLPGFAAILALAWAYVRFGTTPHAEALLGGLNAAVVGVIAAITIRMVSTSIVRAWQMGVAAASLLLASVGEGSPAEIALLGIGSGLVIDIVMKRARATSIARKSAHSRAALPEEGNPLPTAGDLRLPAIVAAVAVVAATLVVSDGSLGKLAVVFLRTGLGAYGGGFAIIPHLETVMRENHWLTARQFADSVAMGKLTPGPVLLMATFIGYVLGGWPAAIVATIAILAGPYALVVTIGTWLNRARSRLAVRAGLRGLTPAVVGLMAASAITLSTTLRGPVEFSIAAATALTLVRFRTNPVVLLAIGGAARVAFSVAGLG